MKASKLWQSWADINSHCSILSLSFPGRHKICLFLPIHCHPALLIQDKIAILNGAIRSNTGNFPTSGPGMKLKEGEWALLGKESRNLCKSFSCHPVTGGKSHLFWFSNEQDLQIVINEAALCQDWCQKFLFSVLGCCAGDLTVRAQQSVTGDFELLRGQCGLWILYSHGYPSPALSVFALLTDTSSVM